MAAGGLGVAGLVAASVPGRADAAPIGGDAALRQHELRVLYGLLRVERSLEYAYHRVLRSWSFEPSIRSVLELILDQEAEHAAALQDQIADLASTPSSAASSASPLPDVVTLFSEGGTSRDVVQNLTKVESLAEASYFDAVAQLRSPDLVVTAAEILACEAQHWSLLLNVLNHGDMPQVVPDPFVRGVGQIST